MLYTKIPLPFVSRVTCSLRTEPQQPYKPQPATKRGWGICVICEKPKRVTKHHLKPKQLRNMPALHVGIELVCRECHDGIHQHFTNHQLLNTHWPDVVERVRKVAFIRVPDYAKKQARKIKRAQERSALGIRPKRVRQ